MTELPFTFVSQSKLIRFWGVVVITIGLIGTTLGYIGAKGATNPPITNLIMQQQNTLVEVKEDLVTIKRRVGSLEQQATKLTTEINQLKNKK